MFILVYRRWAMVGGVVVVARWVCEFGYCESL